MHKQTLSQADRAALENLWGDAGIWAADTWTELNETCFDGEVRYHGVVWGLTPHGSRLGHTSRQTGRVTLHPALLDPQGNAWGKSAQLGDRYARDVLVHEMVHVVLFDRGENFDHNGQPWSDEIMRITPLLGLKRVRAEPVKPRRIDGVVRRQARDGYLDRDTIAHWPHSLRATKWYHDSNGRMHVPV